ncbi:hypothetical protein [Dictyobacter aurantiacus]|uniref:Uncharacterized protein n=1 Tax=Dictyobacter aurantiacus TaxID=1936993 RepID=A0A401ZI74_9CHLR|nr:hypothetical protein [Dictyobacter aurantiacus]GCE06544.1 hypothetical protein KDAU_38730 [Dictyobacter aurantiacus]
MALRYRICLWWLAIQLSLVGILLLPGDLTAHAQQKPPAREFVVIPIQLKSIAVTALKLDVGTYGKRQQIPVFKATFDITLKNPLLIRALQPSASTNLKAFPLKGARVDVIDVRSGVATFQKLSATTTGPFGFEAKASSLQLSDAVAQVPLPPAQVAALAKLKPLISKDGIQP